MDVKFTVIVSIEEIVVRQAIRAGTDGPLFSIETVEVGYDTDAVAEMLRREGFEVDGPWRMVRTYEGMKLEATLIRI